MDPLLEVVRKHWGHSEFLPFQREAMTAALEGRDSLVVLPTGGGKSLCYQTPALLLDEPTVVVSPLISLMKDQVDRLLSLDIPAAFLNSSLDADDRRRVYAGIAARQFRLIFVSPERFAAEGFERVLAAGSVGAFAIDEAHCISHWGHDFRADYRELGRLKQWFPDASVHAFTATATPRVRDDIVAQLGLENPAVLVGDFFRPNLRYRVARRTDAVRDVLNEIEKHPGQAGIVYCIRRADVDEMAPALRRAGVRAAPYHAGMTDEARTAAQDRFASGKTDVIVATVAFGMGIDRADVRFVIHAAMPKSLEHYQQESGRAGRDGASADCVLFYSGQDYQLWRTIIEGNETGDLENKLRMLSEMYGFCSGARCRHRRLVEYFGQTWKGGPCGACDACDGGLEALPDSTELAQKILASIARMGGRYGSAYVSEVLRGEATERVVERGHDKSPDFGILADRAKAEITGWIDEMVDADVLRREGEYRVLKLTPEAREILRGERPAMLRTTAPPTRRRAKAVEVESPGPVDMALYDRLKRLRRSIADERGVPAFMVLSDKTLRAIAQARPATSEQLLAVKGIGPAKLADYGERLLEAVLTFLPARPKIKPR